MALFNVDNLPFKPFVEYVDYKEKKIVINNLGEFMSNKGIDKKDFLEAESGTYRFNVGKVLSYNSAFKVSTKNGHFAARYNEEYDEYKKVVGDIYENFDHVGQLTKFLTKPTVQMTIEFHISNKRLDLDNIQKTFIDALYNKAKTKNKKANDNSIYEMITRKKITYNDYDYIIIKFKTLTIEEIEKSSLLYEDNQSF